ncbi:MAG: hypothetical protein F8N37_14600 [Telmatospirillum sp.]|nr:hypothetical protein [Telmatospirillum sp.]
MDLLPRLIICALLTLVAFYATYANRTVVREPGRSLVSFLLDSQNFNDWGKLWRIVCLVSFLAFAGVATMKMVAILLGGPIIDLDQFG